MPDINLLLTGATGFVASNIARRILGQVDDSRAVLLDIQASSALAHEFFADYADRIDFVQADMTDATGLRKALDGQSFTHVIHAAAITHDAATERAHPQRYIDVNVMGTAHLLEWMRHQTGVESYIHVSTGGVYGAPSDLSPPDVQPESGPFDPPEMYALTKYAAELIARRYGELYGIPTIRVRFADVFGPMERPTGARRASSMSCVYRMMRAAVERRPLTVSQRTLEARIDLTSAEDVAAGVAALARLPDVPFDVCNISAGQGMKMADIFEAFSSIEPRFALELCEMDRSEIDYDPANTKARYNIYDTTRMAGIGWAPRPLLDQLASYRAWVLEDPDRRCPPLATSTS